MDRDRYLIVNADDFGLTPGVNRGVIEAHRAGIVTSASLMVRTRGAADAARLAGKNGRLSLGLHVDLGEWRSTGSGWEPLYRVVDLESASEVRSEVDSQLETFNRLVGRNPTHLDSHQHVHLRDPVRKMLTSIAAELGVFLRRASRGINYCGDFYGQTEDGGPLPDAVTVGGLLDILEKLPPGLTELSCHPAERIECDTMYRAERIVELRTLCDPRVRDALRALGVRLCSFSGIPRRFTEAPR